MTNKPKWYKNHADIELLWNEYQNDRIVGIYQRLYTILDNAGLEALVDVTNNALRHAFIHIDNQALALKHLGDAYNRLKKSEGRMSDYTYDDGEWE